MGSGEVGGNRSVHWKVKLVDDASTYPAARGADPIPFEAIGVAKGHRGQFVVTLRYDDLACAQQALKDASDSLRSDATGATLKISVRARYRNDVDKDDLPWEVKVDW